MNRIELHGSLREAFGPGFDLDVRDPREAFRALNCQLPGFARLCVEGNFMLVRELPNGSMAVTEDMFFIGMSNSTLHFLPNVEGAADKGVGKMILGIGLIAASVFIPGVGGVALGMGLTLKTVGISLGLALAFGGAAMLLSPTPQMDDAEETQSFLFSGDVNTAGQGFAVPVTYGYDRVNPIPIATQIKTNEYRVGDNETVVGTGPSGDYVGDPWMVRNYDDNVVVNTL